MKGFLSSACQLHCELQRGTHGSFTSCSLSILYDLNLVFIGKDRNIYLLLLIMHLKNRADNGPDLEAQSSWE